MLQASWIFDVFWEWNYTFHTVNIKSIGQRAAKLQAVKVGGSPKKSDALAITAKVLGPGLTLPGFESFLKF